MSKWVTRRGLGGKIAGPPVVGLEKNLVTGAGGLKTIDECIASSIERHEVVEGEQRLRTVLVRGQVVVFVAITEGRPPE